MAFSGTWIGQTPGRLEVLKDQRVPLLPYDRQKAIGDLHRKARAQIERSRVLIETAHKELDLLDLEVETAIDRLERSKPPR